MKFQDWDPLVKRRVHDNKDLPFNKKAYVPFALTALALVVLWILKGINSRWFVGMGLILNLTGSFLVLYYSDRSIKSYIATFGQSSYGEVPLVGVVRNSLERDANKKSKYALYYLVVGVVLQFIGLLINP